jgi:hypothetical protein
MPQRIETAVFTSLEALSTRLPGQHGVRVSWFKSWHPALDEALALLPESEACSHELFRLLVQNPSPARKRTALVSQDGEPVAVVGLRESGYYRHQWELVTKWITPGFLFPVKPGCINVALEALRVPLAVIWQRMDSPPPEGRQIKSLTLTPTYRMNLPADFEGFWRKTHYLQTIKKARKESSGFTLAVNPPGVTPWVITNAEKKWGTDANQGDTSGPDRIAAADYLEPRKGAFTLALLEHGSPVAVATLLVHGRALVSGVLYRRPEYDRYHVGIRIIDAYFQFAAEAGFSEVDLDGGHDHYKAKWAPKDGTRAFFHVCPPVYSLAKRVFRRGRLPYGKLIPPLD